MIVHFDIPGLDATLPGVQVDRLVIEKSMLGTGYDCEVTLLGVEISNLRIPQIDVPCLVLLIQEAARTAWGAVKHTAEVTDFQMTVNRGANNGH